MERMVKGGGREIEKVKGRRKKRSGRMRRGSKVTKEQLSVEQKEKRKRKEERSEIEGEKVRD